jgi:hypothetical protein
MASSPKFVPSSWAVHPDQFGKYAAINWKDVAPATAEELDLMKASLARHQADPMRMERELDRVVAARQQRQLDQRGASIRQHQLSLTIRHAILADYATITHYAHKKRIGYKRLTAVLRGDALMRFEDMANAERNLKIELMPSDPADQQK